MTTRQESYTTTIPGRCIGPTMVFTASQGAVSTRCEAPPETVTRYTTVTVPETRDVEREGSRQVERRHLQTAAEAELTIARRDGPVVVRFAPEAQVLDEARYETPHGSRAFSDASLASQQEAMRRSLAAFLSPAGAFQQALAASEARRLVAAARGADAEVAETLYARALALAPEAALPGAAAFFSARYGLTAEQLRDVVR